MLKDVFENYQKTLDKEKTSLDDVVKVLDKISEQLNILTELIKERNK